MSDLSDTQFTSESDLVDAYKSLQSKFSNQTRVPGEGATPSELREFHTKMGAPASHEGYVLPEGVADMSAAREAAFANGVTAAAWDAIAASVGTTQATAREARVTDLNAQAEKWQADNRAALGENFESTVAKVDRFFEAYKVENPGAEEALKDRLTHPEVVKMLAKMADASGNHSAPTGANTGGGYVETGVALATQIRTVMANEAWRNKRHPEHKSFSEKYKTLQRDLSEAGYAGINDPRLA